MSVATDAEQELDLRPSNRQTRQQSDSPQGPMVSGKYWQYVDGAWKKVDKVPLKLKKAQEARDKRRERRRASKSRVGRSPLLDPQLNENVESITEAINSKKHPERLSVMFEPAPFNRDEFLADPQAYLNIFEPGRAFQNLPSGSDAPRIKEIGQQYHEVLRGETAVLKTRVEPNMPVTFYSPRLGQFENQLPAITVQADENGLATARFKATPGTRGYIDIVAGSPTRRGQAKYLIKVVLPN